MQIEPLPAGTTASLAPDAVRAGAPREVPQIVGGRFRVLSLRGRGAEATVYLAIDLFSGREVALKIGPPARLEAEYRRSAELIHPHLAQPIALWRGPASAALAFEYGAEDLTALRGAPEPLIVRHVAGVARALGHLHRRGIVHGDVKPANAVLAGPPEDRRALLVDLGLAGADPVARGSLEYAAPEVIEGAAPEMASDLYSLGVTLHELISGSNPFARSTAAEVIRARFEHQPPPSRASAGVQAVVSKLLAREPRSRYAQADEVIEALAAATGLSLEADGSGLGSDAIGMGPLHGREAELARLELAARRAAAGEGEQLLLAGAPGSGRTRLLRAAAVAAELAGLRTIHLCHGEGLAALCRRLGLLIGAAAPLTPSVGAGRERLAMACAQHPLAVLIDDADRSDDWLPALLLAIAHDPAWKRRPLLLVATASLQTDLPVELIEVQPLAVAEAKARLMEILGPQDWAEGVADRIVAESGGCPRDLEEAIADLEQRGLLRRRAGRWELDRLRAGPGSSGCVPRPALRAAREAVVALPPQRRAELGIAAVLWQDIDAAALGGLDADAVAGGLRIAEEMGRHLSQLALFRAAEGALPPGERRNAHLRAAGMAKDPAARAAHLFRAREDGALRAGLAAARGELRRGFPGTAARLYEMAEAAARRPLWHPRTAVLAERAGDCLALAGHAQAARQSYFRALGRGGAPGRIWQKVAKAHWQEGRFESVLQALLRAREGGGDALAVATIEARAEAMRGNYARAEELAREALPLARERGDAAQATRLHHLLGTSAWHRGDGRRAAVEERVAVLIARRIGDARAEADARAGLGTAWKLLANYERSARETSRAVELYRALGDERQESIAWNNLGVARYLAGNWSGALEAWERLAQKKTQTLEEELLTLNNLGFLYRERGDLPRARELLDNAISKIRSAGGYARIEAMARGNLGETAARAGDLAAAERLYGEALEIARRIGARDEVVETGRRRCELDLLRRDAAGAAARAAETLDLAVQSANVVEQGNLWRVVAMAARVRGDAVAAASAIGKAHQLLRGVSSVLEDARVDCVECLLDLDRGEPLQAAAALRRARSVFERVGAAPDLLEVDRLEKEVEALQRKSFSHVEALTQAAQRLAARGDPAALLEDALDEALLLTGAERGFILLTEEGREPRIAALRGPDATAALRISRTVTDRVLQTGEMVAIADIVGNEDLSTRKSILDLGLRSVLCTPIRFGGRRLGILYVDSRRIGSLLTAKDLGLLSAFAALAGSALENARLIEDLRRKTDLLAHMAHEFRTPLQGITGYAELVKMDEGLGPRGRRGLEVIASQAARLAKIVDRTLELSRMEAGAVRLGRAGVELREVAAAAIDILEPIARMKGIEVTLDLDPAAPRVRGDFDRLVQVITNLVGNAIQYSGQGREVAVRVLGGEELPQRRALPRIDYDGAPEPTEELPHSSARILVVDRGPGIAPEDVGRLFTPFFRATGGSGTGLGLVISREIVRQHGGDIQVSSRPGEGTTFAVLLPGAS